MTMSSIGIDISDASIKYVRFKDSGDDDLELVTWGDHQLPEGTVVGGEVKNGKALSEALRHLCGKCKTSYVRVSLPEERAYIFETVIPKGTPFAEIRGLLEFSLEENVPLSPKDAFFDYEIVEGNESEEKLHVVVTVYAREVILSYYQACTEAGLSPVAFEVEAAAVAHAVAPKSKDDTFMVVDFGRRRTGIGIVHKGVLTYTSTIEVGGTTLSTAMRGILGETEEDELTRIKNKDGIRADASDAKLRTALIAPIDTMVDALRARFEYWNTRSREHGQRPITKIVLCGGSSNLAGFPEYLTDALGVPAERADVWGNAFPSGETVPPIPKTHSYGYTTAIGLALSDYPDFKNRTP
ncbi:pilus assembly protein PilM [Candidatus Parcubacteria bacterium]|nr:pilus assembly protein PilM [Candidatus Parcubacteria bacterium]